MDDFKRIADIVMCALWVFTYLSVFLIMLITKRVIIHPVTTLLGLAMELGILIAHISNGDDFNYVTISYACWSIIEIGIVILHIKYKSIEYTFLPIYLFLSVLSIIGVFLWANNYTHGVTYCNFILTTAGMLVWLTFLFLKKQTMHWSYLIPFVSKLVADVLVLYVYFDFMNWFINTFCIVLPIVDHLFIVLFIVRRYTSKVAVKSIRM